MGFNKDAAKRNCNIKFKSSDIDNILWDIWGVLNLKNIQNIKWIYSKYDSIN